MTLKIDITTQQIGAPVPDLDGAIYIGIAPAENDMPQGHMVWWKKAPLIGQNFAESVALAKSVSPETESHLPTQTEMSLLYATVRDQMEKGYCYWTSTFYNKNRDLAFVQSFSYGGQILSNLNDRHRALFVSRFAI